MSVYPERLIKIFESVRDIPYRVPETDEEPDHACWGKSTILYKKLKKAGFKVRYRIAVQVIEENHFPEEIKKLAKMEFMNHLFVEVNLGGEWFLLDATYDSPNLSGFNDLRTQKKCKIPGIVNKIYSPKESEEVRKFWDREVKRVRADNLEFYKAFNKLIDDKRKGN